MATPIYLDNNATTRMDPEVLEAMLPYLRNLTANPSSRHSAGRGARVAIEQACEQISSALNVDPDEIIFTSGATEANNIAIRRGSSASRVAVLATEHPSALAPALSLDSESVDVDVWGVNGEGILEIPSTVDDDWNPKLGSAALVIAQLANSETGVVQNIAGLSKHLPERVDVHVDAVQAVGKVPIDFRDWKIASLALSGHKIHGPPGIGALLVSRSIQIPPLLLGGKQQEGVRPGSEPVALIVGLGKAVEITVLDLEKNANHLQKMRDRLEERILSTIPQTVVNGSRAQRLPGTSNISFLGVRAEALLMALDLNGVQASAGTACASGSLEPSPALLAMGLAKERVESAVRFSLSRFTTEDEIDRAGDIISSCVARLRQSSIHPH